MPHNYNERINALRAWLERTHHDAIIIPLEDEFLSEYPPTHNRRLEWATGFTGSAGLAVVAKTSAAIFVDGRYTVQAAKQVSGKLFNQEPLSDQSVPDWLVQNCPKNGQVALDPQLHSINKYNMLLSKLTEKLTLSLIQTNPIDELWHDRPKATLSNVWLMDNDTAGTTSAQKRQKVALQLSQSDADHLLIKQLDNICWLLNMRGFDVPHLPVALSSALLDSQGKLSLFIDKNRLPDNFFAHVGDEVTICEPDSLETALRSLQGQKVALDPQHCNLWAKNILEQAGAKPQLIADPCFLLKSSKNSNEINGMKACHLRDGVAVSRFLAWLEQEVTAGAAHDEETLAQKLLSFRKQDTSFLDLSFSTISAAGGNAAMCHYNHTNQEKPAPLARDNVYLVDSGTQYRDGTTDVTRTVAIGNCPPHMKKMFTLVLKGHIALACAKFPVGTTGEQLDALARQFLWAHGYDYDHGTGHGVGHCLNVHEGPQRIAKQGTGVALQEGMVLSNEPGFYQAEQFGIRIENLELVVKAKTNGDREMLGFTSLTCIPIDKRMLDLSLLTPQEINWWNNYHQSVFEKLNSYMKEKHELSWLKQACAPL
ncbi:MAG: aminopeptidase P family protein [Vibrionaceae bacterium]